MNYAQIINGKVNLIVVDSEEDLNDLRNAGLEINDISNLEVKPETGWKHNGGDEYSEPDPEPIKKTVYTKNQFLDRIRKNKDVKISDIKAAAETDNDIAFMMEFVPTTDTFDMNNPPGWLVSGMDALVTAGIYTQEEIDGILER